MEPIDDGKVENTITLWHSDHLSDTITKVYDEELILEELTIQKQFTANGSGTLFELESYEHAYEFQRCSPDDGTTWLYPSDYLLTWGSNDPTYDNEVIDSDGYFAINFMEAPISGTTVLLEYIPKINRYKVATKFKQPQLPEESFVDYKSNVRQTDYAIEFLK
jgi:hypothetical protein